MALLTLARSPTLDCRDLENDSEEKKSNQQEVLKEEQEVSEEDDAFDSDVPLTPKKHPKLARLRSPSFEGYFASRSGPFALQIGNSQLKSTADKLGEIQVHLEYMISLLREIDVLRMAVRIESKKPTKKRYLTVVSNEIDQSAIVGIDWTNEQGPTIGLVLPIWSSTILKLDGDGGFKISHTLSTRNHTFKPVSVQTLWSARQVIDKASDFACKHKYYEGISTNGFLEYYTNMMSSDDSSITEWNEMDDLGSHVHEMLASCDEGPEREFVKGLIRCKLREVMRNLKLDEVTCKEVRLLCEKELNMDLKEYRQFIDEDMLVVMGQMDYASKILDYLYLGSEWNATNLTELKEIGIGFILNITREVDNFFPLTFSYYNVRVLDVEETELLKHWDHTYRFIEKARESNSKVLVHCRQGISRSSATVIAYIMKKFGWSMMETLEYVKGKRSIVNPNPGFQKQLIIYEGILNSSRNRFSSLFHQRTLKDGPHNQKTVTEKRKLLKKSQSVDDQADGAGEGKIPKKDDVETEVDVEESVIVEAAVCPPFTADISFAEEIEVECTKQSWQSPASQRGRLLRAKTMVSGAVFIDEDDISDTTSSVNSDDNNSSELTDPDEDALMQEVVVATQRKTALMKCVEDLQSKPLEGDTTINENNIRPSILRKLQGSAVMHFENIAKMKRRKSLKKKEDCFSEDETKVETNAIKKNTVSSLSEMFTKRSKKHVRDYARRRTLDDDSFTGIFDMRSIEEHKRKSVVLDSPTASITEIPERSLKLELAAKTEKILPETKTQYPRYRQYGRIGRTASLKIWRHFDRQRSQDTDEVSNTSMEALNLETDSTRILDFCEKSEKIGSDSKIGDEFCVADLVHLHDKIIREKHFRRQRTEEEGGRAPDREIQLENEEKLYHVLVRGKLKGVQPSNSLRIKRVQSFPGIKREKTLDDGSITRHPQPSPRDTDECQSLPASPNCLRKSETLDFYSTSSENSDSVVKDVQSIVNAFETKKQFTDESVKKIVKNKNDPDLRSMDTDMYSQLAVAPETTL